jgi:hypothetical protein
VSASLTNASNYWIIAYKPLIEQSTIDKTSETILRSALETCRQRGINAKIILMPEHSQLRNSYTDVIETHLDNAVEISAEASAYSLSTLVPGCRIVHSLKAFILPMLAPPLLRISSMTE